MPDKSLIRGTPEYDIRMLEQRVQTLATALGLVETLATKAIAGELTIDLTLRRIQTATRRVLGIAS